MHRRALAFLSEHAAQGEVRIVAGSRFAADDLARSACGRALVGVYRYGLRDLVYALSEEPMCARGLAPVRQIAREAIAAGLRSVVRLTYLKDAAEFPGFPRALARTLSELRLNGISPDALRGVGRSGDDMAELLAAYNSELRRRKLADYAERVQLAIVAEVPPMPLVLLDVPLRSACEEALLRKLGTEAPAVVSVSLGPDDHRPETILEAVQLYALSGETAPRLQPDDSVRVVSASSESLEAVEIARTILYGGTPFDCTAVLLRDPARQGPLIREAFERAGIPAWYAQGAERPDPGGRALLTLLRFRQEDYSATRFAEYLSLGQVPHEPDTPNDRWRWEWLMRRHAVIGGRGRWEARADMLESLAAFALPVIRKLDALPARATWREYAAGLREIATLTVHDPRNVEEVLDELSPLADVGEVAFGEMHATLERQLASLRSANDSPRYGRVLVGGIEEARAMVFDTVYVPGLNEGAFPRRVREDPLLLDVQRAHLGILGSRDDGELLHVAAACASRAAVFSFARIDLATGRERVPSFFAAEIMKIAGEAKDCPAQTSIGWSAPPDPLESIDDTEYDLATFRLARGQGSFAWIRQVNTHAARSIRTRADRWAREWSEADGPAGQDVHLAAKLGELRLTAQHWSASDLQHYARCPYRFLLSSIVGLKPFQEPQAFERINPLSRGRLFHKVIEQVLAGTGELDEVLQREANALAVECAPPIPAVWDADVRRLGDDLRVWLEIRDPAWSVIEVEKKFETTVGPYKIQGRIDLVEKHNDGSLRVVDHKTGRPGKEQIRCVGRGEVLQPVLYALGAEEMYGQAPVTATLSYASVRENFRVITIRIDDGARASLLRVLEAIDTAIRQAVFPAAPKRKGCEYCEYLPVCGPYEEIRAASKEPIPALTNIRRLE